MSTDHEYQCPYAPEEIGFGGMGKGSSTARYFPGIPCQCELIRAVRSETQANDIGILLRMPPRAQMEIACTVCGFDYGWSEDLLDLFGAYTEHECPAVEE